MSSPIGTSLKRKVPRTENIKYISISSENTLNNEGRENVIVCIKAYRPLYLLINLNNLETLRTLITLAS